MTDAQITQEEVEFAIKHLKTHKAPGWDGLPPSLFKLFGSQLTQLLCDLLNQVVQTGKSPSEWSTGNIKPIHKSGNKSDPNNYQAITLFSTMGNIFTSIIRDRLMQWAETESLLNEAQFGFRQGRRTTNPIFILNIVIQHYKKKKKPLYTCFVDFKKAFDSVSHNKLWLKLASIGISSKILTLLKSMYSDAISIVKINSEISSSCPCTKGARQGCNLSPLLFSLYIADLEKHLYTTGSEGADLLDSKLCILMFAGDIVYTYRTLT